MDYFTRWRVKPEWLVKIYVLNHWLFYKLIWVYHILTSLAITCATSNWPSPANGKTTCRNQSEVNSGLTCVATCDRGFKIDGLSTSTCGIDGIWSPKKTPNCRGIAIARLMIFSLLVCLFVFFGGFSLSFKTGVNVVELKRWVNSSSRKKKTNKQTKNTYLSVNVFSTKVLIGDTICTSPTEDRTTILRDHPSQARV